MSADRNAIMQSCIQATVEIYKVMSEDQRPDDPRRSADLVGAYSVRMFKSIERHFPEFFEETYPGSVKKPE